MERPVERRPVDLSHGRAGDEPNAVRKRSRNAAIGQTVELPDDPAVRGQLRAVRYLVEVEEVAAPATRKSASRKKEEDQA